MLASTYHDSIPSESGVRSEEWNINESKDGKCL